MGRNGDLLTLIFSRETRVSGPVSSSRRISASPGLVERMDLHSRLVGHQDCVNAVEFNPARDVIVSGSNDGKVSLWDWSQRKRILSHDSGHCHNILEAKIVPFPDDQIIATSSLDGQVRLGWIMGNGGVETECIGHHEDAVHQLAIDSGSSIHMLYSCGEDGFVHSYDLRCKFVVKLFRCLSTTATNQRFRNYVGLNSMAIDPRAINCVALGGSDALVRIYDIRQCRMDMANLSCEPVNIFCPPGLELQGHTFEWTDILKLRRAARFLLTQFHILVSRNTAWDSSTPGPGIYWSWMKTRVTTRH
ncbi:hypothetical protein MLD38_009620 [Melastoma candidum]|uniref:Uncharacterized protein n=1 Tax=Melastoma candidum TaxID=119954 RepID=A0ACB9S1T9_9MYRT|nr:hypothetical protein MLD38_009620 [Melastoma candidum]